MATKRSHSEVHPSRREQVPHTARKKHKPDNLGPKSFKKAYPVNGLKTRVRNVERLLNRQDDKLPAHIRISKERELQTLKHELRETQAADKRSKMIAKYHKIRFFDRQKAIKRLKQAKKALSGLDDDVDEKEKRLRQADIEEAETNLNYALYYPLDKPYHSLFPKDREHDNPEVESKHSATLRGDSAIRQLVRDCMVNNTLDDLREGKLTRDDQSDHVKDLPSTANLKPTTTKSAEQDDDAEESDGGFFE